MPWVEILKFALIFLFPPLMVPVLIWMERKLIADFQQRIGPNRVGPFGLLQPIADGLKLLLKEDIVPVGVDKVVYTLAPLVAMTPALMVFAVVPFSDKIIISDLNIAVLYILGLSSLGVYGVVLAGWGSNSKYSLLGALRSAAQMISYELPMGAALIGPVLLAGSLSLKGLVQWQIQHGPLLWYQPVAFVILLCAAVAEVNRAPFDLPEAETELVAGFHTEYSGFKFAMFFLAEYANMLGVSALAISVFLSGWQGPHFLPGRLAIVTPLFWFMVKLMAFMFLFMWLRATFPRLRYDKLMRFGWLRLLPLALLSLTLTALVAAYSPAPSQKGGFTNFVVGAAPYFAANVALAGAWALWFQLARRRRVRQAPSGGTSSQPATPALAGSR